MKIAYYIDTVIPTKRANMVHVMKMCQAFSELGHSTALLCDSSEKCPDLLAIRSQYSVSDKFDIITAHIPDLLIKYGHRFAAYYGAWKKASIRTDCDFAYSRSAATLFFLRENTRYVFEAHMEPDAVNRWIEHCVLAHKNCIGLVVISDALKKRYLQIFPFIDKDRITVLHDAADTVPLNVMKKDVLKTQPDKLNVGYVGHLYPGKCMETLIPLAQSCPDLCFHVVGGTDEWLEHWKSHPSVSATDNLIFYGYVDNCRVGDYYTAFDVVILPFSKNVKIGKSTRKDIGKWISPLKLFEAMAYGKPIIVSRLETIEEVMSDGEDCIMVEPDNIQNWVEKLTALCNDRHLQKKIGAAAQEKLEQEYTWIERARKASALFD